MYDSLTNGESFQKPKFDYKAYIKSALSKPIKAPEDAFLPRAGLDDESGSESDEDEELKIPETFRSRREERLYLGRGGKFLNVRMLRTANRDSATIQAAAASEGSPDTEDLEA